MSTLTAAIDTKAHLELLQREFDLARDVGLDRDVAYMADLCEEIASYHAAWVGAAVTEIASLRGQMHGRPQG